MKPGNGTFPVAKLEDLVIEAATGFACGQRATDGVIQLRMNNVTRRGELDWSSFIRVPAEKAMLNEYALRTGDVVFNNTNSTEMVGKTALFVGFHEPVVFSNHFTRLRTKADALAPDFLALWLHSQWQAGLFARICDRWIGQSAVQRNKLLALEVPLPPLAEQRRIAARLREQLSILAEARAALEAQLAAAESLPAAHLRAVFDVTEAASWPKKTISEMIRENALTEHQDGNHGELHPRNRDFVADGVKFVTAKHVSDDGEVLLTSAPFISQQQASGLRIGFAQADDVLLAHNATVGRVGIAPQNCAPFIVGTSLTIYRANAEMLHPKFVFYALRAAQFQRQLIDAMKQTTRNQVPITKQRTLWLPIPSLDVQRDIAGKLSHASIASGLLHTSLREKLFHLEKLPAALLRSAFNPNGD
jgi:type I restriction enzyme S subunit